MQDNSKRPNFLGIGAPKCATTWLAEVLQGHPEIFIAHGKELVYFSSDKKYQKGENWYLKHFEDSNDETAIGEFSVSYMGMGYQAAERIFQFNPDMKLIAILRDPIKRSWSHYNWLRQLGKLSESSILEAIKSHPQIVDDSLYHKNISYFWSRFNPKNTLLLKYEDIQKDSNEALRTVYRFLSVDENFDSRISTKVVGKTIKPKFQWIESLRIKTHTFLRKNKFAFLISTFKQSGLSRLYRKINDSSDKAAMTKTEFDTLKSLFADDVRNLATSCDMDLSNWLQWSPHDK